MTENHEAHNGETECQPTYLTFFQHSITSEFVPFTQVHSAAPKEGFQFVPINQVHSAAPKEEFQFIPFNQFHNAALKEDFQHAEITSHQLNSEMVHYDEFQQETIPSEDRDEYETFKIGEIIISAPSTGIDEIDRVDSCRVNVGFHGINVTRTYLSDNVEYITIPPSCFPVEVSDDYHIIYGKSHQILETRIHYKKKLSHQPQTFKKSIKLCFARIQRGPRKGRTCGADIKDGSLRCRRHMKSRT
jgi:hypothetical protein